MHLLALGAFWLLYYGVGAMAALVVMHLLALGAFWRVIAVSDARISEVVMHLLALGAFWQRSTRATSPLLKRRNAPSGARCFLAYERYRR